MPEYLAPGVYIEEISTRAKPIEGVGTSTAGFVGLAERGPEYPRFIASWLEFQRWFGGYLPVTQSYLAHAVQGFFGNGGQRCFVARIVPGADSATGAILDIENLRFAAIGRGTWGNNLLLRIRNDPTAADDTGAFELAIIYYRQGRLPDLGSFVDPLEANNATNPGLVSPDALEIYENLVHTEGAARNVMTIVNSASQLVRCWFQPGTEAIRPPNTAFADAQFQGGAQAEAATVDDFDGNVEVNASVPGTPPPPDDLLGRGRGLNALATVDEVAILAAPDEVFFGNNVTNKVIQQCEKLADRFAVTSAPRGINDPNAVSKTTDTKYAAIYYPWIKIFDAVNNRPLVIPPTGHVLGIYARTDIERGVHKAPANAVARGVIDLEFPVTKAMQDMLNPKGINCFRDFRPDGRGIRLWGARTMSSDSEWKYVNVRRLFIFIEESIEEGTQWVVFEPNFEPTWAKVVRSITNFLVTIWKNGALEGVTQDEAFFVKCDRTTMTQDDIDNGRLICYIGVAPVKPAEFVIFRISQKTREATG